MKNFYCDNKAGGDFDIAQWDKAFKKCIEQELTEEEIDKILEGDPCKDQCFDCMAIVGNRRRETQALIKGETPVKIII